MNNLGRLITAMVTPFNEKGEVDYEQAKKLALALLDSGSDGLAIAATTGEAPTLTWEEEMRLFTEIKSVVGDRGTLVAYTGSNNTAEAIEAVVFTHVVDDSIIGVSSAAFLVVSRFIDRLDRAAADALTAGPLGKEQAVGVMILIGTRSRRDSHPGNNRAGPHCLADSRPDRFCR